MARLTHDDRAVIRRRADEGGDVAAGIVRRLLYELDALDPPPVWAGEEAGGIMKPKPEDDPAFHFARVQIDVADLHDKIREVMDRMDRLAESMVRTKNAFDANREP